MFFSFQRKDSFFWAIAQLQLEMWWRCGWSVDWFTKGFFEQIDDKDGAFFNEWFIRHEDFFSWVL